MAQSGSQTDSFTKNVTLLKREDVTLRNGDVFTPNNIEMSILRRAGQYKSSVEFFRSMTTDDVERRLKESFPIVVNKRFSCAAREAQNSAKLNFHGDHRVWDGRTIKSKLKGGSALYVVMEDEDSFSAMASPSSVQGHNLNTDNNQQDSYSAIGSSSSVQGYNRYIENNQQVSQWLSQTPTITSNGNNNSSDTFLQADDSFDLDGSFDLQELMLFDRSQGFCDVFTALNSAQLNGQSQIAQGGLPLSTSTDPSSLQLESVTMTDQMSSHETSHLLNNNGNWSDQVTPPTAAIQENNKSQKDQASSSSTRGQSDSGLSSEESLSQYQSLDQHTRSTLTGVDVIIKPSCGPLEGGESFYLEFDKTVAESVISGWATFGKKQVKVWKTYEGCILHGKEIPSGEAPGPVTVTITSQYGDYLGKTQFTYVDQRKQLVEETVSNKRKLAYFFSEVAKQFKSEASEENTTQTRQQSALANEGNRSAAGDILKLLVYTAAQIGAEGFIRFIFSSSAGQNVFEAYRNESLLPEHIAEANGHENIAAYIRDITKRFMEEDRKSQTQSTNMDWLELARAVEESEEQFESFDGKYVAQLWEDEILERAYFGDTETSSDSEKERSDSEDTCKRHVDTDEKQQQEDLVNFEFAEVASTDSECERSCSGHQFEMESASKDPSNGRRTICLEIEGTVKLDNVKQTQIMIGRESTGKKKFFVWESEENGFSTAIEDLKNYVNATIGFSVKMPEKTDDLETPEVEDLTAKIHHISEELERLEKRLSNITFNLEVPELKDEAFAIPKKLDLIDRHSRTLQALYTKVTGMTGEACKCDELVRRNFYDFAYHSLRAVHNDLCARVADLQSAEANMKEEEKGNLRNLLSYQRGREKQVKYLEERWRRLFSTPEAQLKAPRSTPESSNPPSDAKNSRSHSDVSEGARPKEIISQKDLKTYVDATNRISTNTTEERENAENVKVVEEERDLTVKEREVFEKLGQLQKTLSDIITNLEMHELKDEKFDIPKKLDLTNRHGRTLQELYTAVTGMTGDACKCNELVRREFYDFTYHRLRAVHNDLNARVTDLQSGEVNMNEDEKGTLRKLLSCQKGRKTQVEQLEKLWMRLFTPAETQLKKSQSSSTERERSKPPKDKKNARSYSDGACSKGIISRKSKIPFMKRKSEDKASCLLLSYSETREGHS